MNSKEDHIHEELSNFIKFLEEIQVQQFISVLDVIEAHIVGKESFESQVQQGFSSGHLRQILVKISRLCMDQKKGNQMVEFILRDYKTLFNLFRYGFAFLQHYFLLYDILQMVCLNSPSTSQLFLKKVRSWISGIGQQDQMSFLSNFLQILCAVLSIKLQLKADNVDSIQTLKQNCINNQSIITIFAIRLIKQKLGNDLTQFVFLKERIGLKTFQKMTLAVAKCRQQQQAKPQLKKEVELNLLQNKLQTKVESATCKLNEALLSLKQQIKSNKYSKKQCEQKVKTIAEMSLAEVKKVENYKDIFPQLIQLSFTFHSLFHYSLKTSLLILDMQEFFVSIKPILHNKSPEDINRLMSQLRKISGRTAVLMSQMIVCQMR